MRATTCFHVVALFQSDAHTAFPPCRGWDGAPPAQGLACMNGGCRLVGHFQLLFLSCTIHLHQMRSIAKHGPSRLWSQTCMPRLKGYLRSDNSILVQSELSCRESNTLRSRNPNSRQIVKIISVPAGTHQDRKSLVANFGMASATGRGF